MTNKEFSEGFDTMIAAYASSQGALYGLLSFDEYEKSIFLTRAQEEVVKSLYTDSFEKTEAIRRQLDELVDTTNIDLDTEELNSGDDLYHTIKELDLPDLWFIVMEQAISGDSDKKCENQILMDIVPVTHDEYIKVVKNPFRGPSKKRVLRLDVGEKRIHLVSKFPLRTYIIHYLQKPCPIVLVDLEDDGLSIEGAIHESECRLSSSIHQEILARAVQLAIASRSKTNSNQ